MTKRQALKDAREKWGSRAAVQQFSSGKKRVGTVFGGLIFEVKGEGNTWEQAFAEAEKPKTPKES